MASGGMVLPPKLAELQRQMENETTEIKKIEQEYQKVMLSKRQLGEKKSENEMVMTELSLVDEDDSTIYKLVGPVLAKQDHAEAKSSVKARLDYISKEIDRMDHLEKEFIGNVEDKKKIIMKLQNEFRAEA
jgi:prefoldin beta subunit